MMPLADQELANDARWALATRVVASRHFAKAVQLRDLLLYMAKRAIANPAAEVTEQEIGSHVLGRRPDYDPQADNIVRVQIRRLRQKLEEYFATDGNHEPVVITIPKGGHVVRFEPRTGQEHVEPPARPSRWHLWSRWLIPTIVAVAAIAFVAGWFSADRQGRFAPDQSNVSRNALWTRLFLRDQLTTIVLADSSLVIVQNVLQKSITLNDYIDHSYRELIEAVPNVELRDALLMISNRQYTSLADATLSGQLRSLGLRMGAKVVVRYARHMHVRDFNAGNFILVGSRHSVPWVELFEPSLNFHFERVANEPRFGFRNRRSIQGEAEMYAIGKTVTGPQETFATISMVPNLGRNGTVLMLAGATMEATEAAGEFAMGDGFPLVVAKSLKKRSPQNLPYFEILLRTSAMAGAPRKVDVVAWREPDL